MNKNIIIKSIAALTILTSITGVGTTVVEGIQHTAKAEHNVIKIKNTKVAPYNGIFRIGGGTGFLVGKNSLITNKHIVNKVKIGDPVTAHPNGQKDTGGFYKVKNIIEYPGNSDLAMVHIEGIAYYPKGQKLSDHTEILKLAESAKVGDRISTVGYADWYKNKDHLFSSTGTILDIKGELLTSDEFVEGGTSGSPVFNTNNEVIGVHYGSKGIENGTKSYNVYFTPQIKKFILDNIEK
ncbi:trypsin-like serine peptidase [Staphylococcus schweitzeri]|uniref:trypsin-like serine peptidase n=1 Tax=Staphylococcus schweitzeri TaxID=1654388 RepID=UPI000504A7C3|nr:serine protease [Staphylococcus schweitzeri]CDR25822.1 serine protease SplB [Staphylococcus schweitzeri]CDR66314.1 serine protease SplB [Staphylococcus schweitzeri]